MHEYGWSIEYALDVPLAQAFALYAAIDARYGGKKGMTYADLDLLEALRAAKRP